MLFLCGTLCTGSNKGGLINSGTNTLFCKISMTQLKCFSYRRSMFQDWQIISITYFEICMLQIFSEIFTFHSRFSYTPHISIEMQILCLLYSQLFFWGGHSKLVLRCPSYQLKRKTYLNIKRTIEATCKYSLPLILYPENGKQSCVYNGWCVLEMGSQGLGDANTI